MNEKSKKIQLEILCEIDRLCKKHNIKYFLSSGTLLGAVRHQGFIPWDDDIDIELLREDYDKLKEVALKEMNEKYFWQDAETDKYFGFTFSKVKANNTRYIEDIAQNTKAHCGIFIDVLPIDKYDPRLKLNYKKILILRMILLLKSGYKISTDTLLKKVEVFILNIMKLFVTRKRIIKAIKKLILKNNKGDKLANFSTVWFDKPMRQPEWYTDVVMLDFEGKKFPGPIGYDEYLKFLYGDYMIIPPKEKQITHSVLEIDCGDNM